MTIITRPKIKSEGRCKSMTVICHRNGNSHQITFFHPKTYTVYNLKEAMCIINDQFETDEKKYKLVIVQNDGSELVMVDEWPMGQYTALLKGSYHMEMKPIKRQCLEK